MDILENLQLERDFNDAIEQERGRRRCRTRTSEIFFAEMSDFEFRRTFRFNKDAVRHLTQLLGISLNFYLVIYEHLSRKRINSRDYSWKAPHSS